MKQNTEPRLMEQLRAAEDARDAAERDWLLMHRSMTEISARLRYPTEKDVKEAAAAVQWGDGISLRQRESAVRDVLAVVATWFDADKKGL